MTKKEDNKLQAIWKKKIKENANNRCEISGISGDNCQLHIHHYYGRKNKATKWYIPNGICLSAVKHKFDKWSAHESPEWFRGQMMDIRGKKWLDDLTMQANKTFKGTYQKVLDYLEGKTDNYV